MNCANHPEVANVAYCRTCGKPLCANCTRAVSGVIYCENCLAEKLGSMPAAPAPSGIPGGAPYTAVSGPNPALAGILAGFFPFGVGAVYTGQYAKGLAHLGIFVLLVMGFSDERPWYINAALGIALGFFYIYQIIDAVRSAKALQLGQPAPDPFGLTQTFTPGSKIDSSKVPTAAIVLIGLGVLFLLQTSGFLGFGVDLVWPLGLIALGVWLFARRQGMIGSPDRYGRSGKPRSLVGPVILVTVGVLSLIENVHGPNWDHTWPVLLLAVGVAKLLESHTPQPPSMPTQEGLGTTGDAPAAASPSNEVKNG